MRLPEKAFESRPLSEGSVFLKKFEGIIAALSYALSSICIIIFNKSVFSTFGFRSPVFVCLVHLSVSLFLVVLLKACGKIDYPDFDRRVFKKMIPLSLCFVGNILLGLLGTKLINVPMFTTLRRLTALFILLLDYWRTGSLPSLGVATSVTLLITGAIIAGYNDLYFDLVGYSVVVLNNLATTGYLQQTKDIKEELSSFGLLFYNSMIALPILFVWAHFTNEFNYVYNFEQLNSGFFQLFFVLAGVMAFALNITTAWCTQTNGPLTTSITGQTKNLVTTVVGALVFEDFSYNHLLAAGIGVSITGSFLYAYIKYRAKYRSTILQKGEE